MISKIQFIKEAILLNYFFMNQLMITKHQEFYTFLNKLSNI